MSSTTSPAVAAGIQGFGEPTKDIRYDARSGWLALLVGLAGVGASLYLGLDALFIGSLSVQPWLKLATAVGLLFVSVFGLMGVTVIQPREAVVLTWFGTYLGTFAKPGIWWINPLTGSSVVKTALNSHETKTITVNDLVGNPITIAAVFVWRVKDAARAHFDVPDYRNFVNLQAEAALRHVASTHPYDQAEVEQAKETAKSDPATQELPAAAAEVSSLRGDRDAINKELVEELGARVEAAGAVVEEIRITHLAYAPEIAGAMLKRQQAGALVAARRLMVEGAVGIVQDTIAKLAKGSEDKEGIDFDGDRRASMAQNLLVMIVGDREASPVVNVGTLHS